MTKEHVIWKSYGMYSLEEILYQEEVCKEFLSEVNPEIEQTEENITDEIYFRIDQSFEDEKLNLSKDLDGRILAIANMGLWNGRRAGYKVLGTNLSEVLTSSIGCDEKKVYYDGYNVCALGYHHDGYNTVEFREIREDRDIDKLLNKIYMNEPITNREINYYTKSLRKHIKQIYGF